MCRGLSDNAGPDRLRFVRHRRRYPGFDGDGEPGERINAGRTPAQACKAREEIVAFAEQRLQHEPGVLGLCWAILSDRYHDLEDNDKAERAGKRALELLRSTFGEQHLFVAMARTSLGNAHLGLNHYPEALAEFQQTLQICERIKGAESNEAANSLLCIATVYAKVGRYSESEPLYRRSLAIKTKLLDEPDESIALLYFNLGYGYSRQRRWELAESYLQRSLKLYEDLRGPNHFMIARLATRLVGVYQFQKRFAEAEAMAKRAAAINLEAYGPEHSYTVGNCDLANIYKDQGRYIEAEAIYRRFLAYDETLWKNYPDALVSVLDGLAQALAGQKRWEESLQASDRAIAQLTEKERSDVWISSLLAPRPNTGGDGKEGRRGGFSPCDRVGRSAANAIFRRRSTACVVLRLQ